MKFDKFKPRIPKLFPQKSQGETLFDREEVNRVLESSVSSVEASFGHLTKNISDISERTEFLSNDCETLLRLAGGHQNGAGILLEAAQKLEEPMAHVERSLQERKELGDLMSECEAITTKLLQRQKDMIGKLQPLKFMLVFYKIEAANLSAEHQSTFITVSKEIMRLHQMVDETFRKNIAQLTEAKAQIAQAIKRFISEHSKHSQEVSEHRNEITNTISSLDKQLQRNSQQDTDLDHAARSFQTAIQGLVLSLQVEDIFRQRCEAIQKNLSEKPRKISQQAWALLQSRKLEAASKEISDASQNIQDSLASILTQTNDLDQVSVDMLQFEHMTASADGMVQILLDSFDSMKEVFQHSENLSNESRDAVSPVKSLVEGLSVIVTEVSINIQFIALNAQVRSIQVGEGSGLEVLAARTAEISAQLREVGSETAQEIANIQSTVNRLSALIDKDHDSNTAQLQNLESSGGVITGQLHDLRDQTFNALAQVAETMKEVRGFVDVGQQKIMDLPAVSEQLANCSKSIKRQAKIECLSSIQMEKLDAEIAEQMQETEKASHTSISGSKETSTVLWDDEPEIAREESPVANSGSIELF